MKGKKADGKKAVIIQEHTKENDFKKIKNAGIDAVIFKVPCSLKFKKKDILNMCNEAKKEGLLTGISIEVDCEKSVNLQGLILSNIIKKIKPDIYPIIELNKNKGLNKKAFSDKCLKLLNRIKESLGSDCIIKSEIEFANKNLDIRLRNSMFWVVDKEKEKPRNSTVWSEWTCFTYSDKFVVGEVAFEVSEIKESIILDSSEGCNCGHCSHEIIKHKKDEKNKNTIINTEKKCESMKGFIKGEIVRHLQEQLNLQFNAKLKVNGCFTEETLNKCALIMRNAHGPITKIVQERLEANGFSVGPSGSDGIYGDYTIAAVKRFQKKYGLKVTGVVNKSTWRELFIKR